MRITKQSNETLVLSGIPGGAGWMVFATVLGFVLATGFGTLAFREYAVDGWSFDLVMPGFGASLGLLFFVTGAATLTVGRESLTLDRTTQKGHYHARSPVVSLPRPFDFELSDIQTIVIERSTERTRGGRAGSGAGLSETDVCRARLLITRPNRAVVLDETSNARDARVIALANRVARFLDLPVTEIDRRTGA